MRKSILFLITLLATAVLWPVSAWAEVTGSGTEQDPYLVHDWSELRTYMKDYGGYIKLVNDCVDPDKTYATYLEVTNKTVVLDLNGKIIDRGLFKNETGTSNGWVIKVCGGSLTVKGGGIIKGGNSLSNGGGINVESGSLTLENCTIKENKAAEGGGGIYNNNRSITIKDGTVISNNIAKQGGGLCTWYGTCTMEGGSIINNSSIAGQYSSYGHGGGVYLHNGSVFNLYGGVIENNTCAETKQGGGIYVYYQSVIYLKGNPIVRNNYVGNSSEVVDNVNLYGDTNSVYTKFHFTGQLSESARIGFTTSTTGYFTEGLNDNGVVSNFVPDDNNNYAVILKNNEAVLTKTYTITISDTEHGTITSEPFPKAYSGQVVNVSAIPDTGYKLESLSYCKANNVYDINLETKQFNMPSDDVTITASFISAWSELQTTFNSVSNGGTVQLDQDYSAFEGDVQLSVASGKKFTLDLNGHILNMSSGTGRVLSVAGNLTIIDSNPTNTHEGTDILGGIITGGNLTSSSENGAGICVVSGGTLNVSAGTITNNSTAGNGGGIYNEGTLTLSGGNIINNTAGCNGGGVYSNYVNANSRFNLSGGPAINNNKSGDSDALVDDNIYLKDMKITLNGELTNTTPIGISMYNAGIFTSGLNTNGAITNFIADNSLFKIIENNGEAQIDDRLIYVVWCNNKKLYFTFQSTVLTEGGSFTPVGEVEALTITKVWSGYKVDENHAWVTVVTDDLEEVIIESTFNDAEPTSCSQWFKDCINLTSITGLSNLNTNEVTDMSGMFQNCSKLGALTLGANFVTTSVTAYSNLFRGSSIADGSAVLTIDGATISQDDFFATITNGQLVRNVSDNEVDKGSTNTGLYTWKGGKFATCNGKALLTLGSASNGSIAIASGATAISESLYEATPNTTITLSVTPATRYKLKTLTYNDNNITDNSFDMPAGHVTVSATFTADFDPVDTTKDYDASTNPYAIKTVADLQKLSDYVNNGVEEVRDGYIKVVETELDFDGIDFVPIGTDTYPFTGSFDGNNVLIKNLKIDRGDADLCGLFGRVQMGSNHNNKALQNIKIDASCEFKTTGSHVGALAGHRESIKMINCHNLGASVSGTNFVGAIVGGGVLQANDSGNTYDGSLVVANINGTKYWGCGYGVGGNQETSSPSDYAQFTSTTIGGFYGAEGNEDQVTWRYDSATKTLLIKGSGNVSETSPWATYIGAATNNYTLNTEGVNLGDEVTTDADGYFVWHNKQFTSYNQQRSVFIKSNEGGTATKEPSTATIGGTVTLTIQANLGYLIATKAAEYTDDNGQKQSLEFRQISNNTFSFTMPAYPVTIDVTFRTYFDLEDPTKPYEWLYNCYSIKTVEDVLKFSEFVNAGVEYCQTSFFRLPAEATFDFSNVDNFIPIGTEEHPFKGTFSTATMLVKNLHVHTTNGYCGFFGYTDDANIQGFDFQNCTFESEGDYVGALVGYCKDSRIRFDYNKDSSVKGRKYVGGLIGYYNSSDMMWTNSVGYDAEGNEGLPMTVEGDAFVGAVVGNATGTLKENVYNGYTVSIKVAGEERKYFGIGTCDDTNGILTRDLGANVLESTVTGGFCGASGNENNVKWIYDKGTNTLLIKGSGDVEKYNASTAPWKKYVSSESNLKTEGVDISAEVTVSEGSFIWCELPFKTFNNQEVYQVTLDYDNEKGTATLTSPDYTVKGATVTLEVSPLDNYLVKEVVAIFTEAGVEKRITAEKQADGSYKFEMPNANAKIQITFEKKEEPQQQEEPQQEEPQQEEPQQEDPQQEDPQPETISYSQALEWATYYDNCDLTLPEGFEAYYVSNVNTSGDIGSVTLTSTGQEVFKDMPMLIHKTDEETTGIMIKTTHGEIAPTTDTRFKGTAEDITSLSAEDITIYVLRDGMFIPAKASSMTAHKCWLEISKAAGTRGFVINIDNECISSEALEGPGHWYDLNGRPLPTKPRQKGLYIHDGKKTVIK